MCPTYVGHVKVPVGPEDDGEDGEDDLQEGELEGAQLEQEEGAPAEEDGETNQINKLYRSRGKFINNSRRVLVKRDASDETRGRSVVSTAEPQGRGRSWAGSNVDWWKCSLWFDTSGAPRLDHYYRT